jgi:hypothetical protein
MKRGHASIAAIGGAAVVAVVAVGAALAQGRGAHPLFSGGRAPLVIGAPPAGLDDTDSDTCTGCHVDIGAEWRQSMHRQSYTDAVFQAGYRMDYLSFCRNCHAPLSPADRDPQGLAATDGVACSVCHVRDGRVLATRVSAAGERAHAMREEPMLGQSELCAGCHEFSFPDRTLVARPAFAPGEPMQETFSEWRDSAAAARGQTCQDCHMPWTGRGAGRHRSHAFLGLRDHAFVANAIAVQARATRLGDATLVRVTIDVSGVGHAFPTGDMFRQAELRVWPRGRSDLEKRVILGRFFGPGTVRTATGVQVLQRESLDSRLGPRARGPAQTFRFRFDGAGPFEYRLDLLRMPDSLARRQGLDPAATRLNIHQGAVSVPRR